MLSCLAMGGGSDALMVEPISISSKLKRIKGGFEDERGNEFH